MPRSLSATRFARLRSGGHRKSRRGRQLGEGGEAHGCDEAIAAEDEFAHFVPIHFAHIQTKRDPASWPNIGGQIAAVRLSGDERYVVAGQGFAGDGNDAVAVMVVEEVSEGAFADQKRGVPAVFFPG